MTPMKTFAALALSTVVATSAFAANPDVGGAPMFEDKNIIETP